MSIDARTMSPGDLPDRLHRHLTVEVPPSVSEDLDRRMHAAIASAVAPATPLRHQRARWRPRRIVAILAVAAVLAAATPAIRFFEGWGEEFDRVFALSTTIDQSVTDDGYRVTVVRAYADSFGLRLAVTAEDLQDRGWAEIAVTDPILLDAEARSFPMSIGQYGQPSRTSSEGWLQFEVPAEGSGPATRHLSLTIDRLDVRPRPIPTLPSGASDLGPVWTSIAGDWSFDFDLEFFGSQTARPDVSATVGEITVTLKELTVTPAATVVSLTFSGLPAGGPEWDPDFGIGRDGRTINAQTVSRGTVEDTLVYELLSGSDDLSGTWTITIADFHRGIPDPDSNVTTEQESIVGPWVLTFEGPPVEAP